MPRSKRKRWPGRLYLGRDDDGHQTFWWTTPTHFDTKRERDDAIARARTERPWQERAVTPESITGDELADRYIARYARERKASSLDTVTRALKRFRTQFGDRPIVSITAVQAEDWVATVPPWCVAPTVALFNYATSRLHLLDRNPFDGLGAGRGTGRAKQPPPTLEQLDALRAACDTLGDYAPRMRDLMDFAAYTLMRPGELYELRHPDVDLVANRINVDRRLYRGVVDTPKTGAKTIALVPPARAILMRQPTRTRDDGLVFASKWDKQLTADIAFRYWSLVQAAAGLRFDFYAATKHYGVHRLYLLGLSKRAIAAQAGWSESDVDAMLRVYGHADLVALAEVDALYARESDANVTHEDPDVR
jgi:integrase